MRHIMTFALAFVAASSAFALSVGDSAPDFTLQTPCGSEHSLSDFEGKPVVLEWTNYDCPFVKKHYGTGNMQHLQKKFVEKGVVWLSINSSAPGKQGHFDAETWKRRAKENQTAATAILLDPDGTVGRAYGARTTPHMFVIDAEGTLIYQGAIDDDSSANPDAVKGAKNYVKAALKAHMAGEPVQKASTPPYGCSVKY
jgi:peroxiredoxin